jgi:rubrerythrin
VVLDPAADEEKRIEQGARFEEAAARFYRDAGAKMPIREIVRLFERLAKENDLRRERLTG